MKKKIIFILLTIIASTEICFAVPANFVSNASIEGSDGIFYPPTPPQFGPWTGYPISGSNRRYEYRYKQTINTSTTILMNAYDLEGTSVIPDSIKVNSNYKFKAGTWIGISVKEIKSVTWNVLDIEYQEVKKVYTCKYMEKAHLYCDTYTTVTTETKCSDLDGKYTPYGHSTGSCKYQDCSWDYGGDIKKWSNYYEYPYYQEYTCPSTHPHYTYYTIPAGQDVSDVYRNIADNNIKNEIENQIVDKVKKEAKDKIGNTTSLVEYMRPDEPTNRDNIVEEKTYVGDESKEIFGNQLEEISYNKRSGAFKKDYELLQPDICIDRKTAKVTYGDECNSDELKINNATIYDKYLGKNVKYWHYFIPLKTKSTEEFNIKVIKNENTTFSVDECESFMDKEEKYKDYITINPSFGVFEGNYKRGKRNSSDFKKLQKAGTCYISATISFPVSQEFYKEVKEKKTNNQKEISFNGFNFYYKPIDINNPFPNGLTSTSIWNDWKNKGKTAPNLSNSFANTTYTTIIDVNKIREYTKNNPYTSWDNMNTNGKSKFIENQGIVTRTTNVNSFYKLGCGPANENKYIDEAKTLKNPRYIEGCDKQ